MSDLGPEALEVLARARRGLSPGAHDAARVRASVGVAIAAGASSLTAHEAAGSGAPAAAPGLTGVAKLGAVVALAVATGVGGYALGFRAGAAEREQRHAAPVVAPVVVGPTVPLATAPVAPKAVSAQEVELQPLPPPRAIRPERAAASANPSSRAPTPKLEAGETLLGLETRLLARVERALRDDNPRLALGLLGELERAVPGGQLAEERQAARAMAHCELGSDAAPQLAVGFIDAYPESAYVARVREACVAALEQKTTP